LLTGGTATISSGGVTIVACLSPLDETVATLFDLALLVTTVIGQDVAVVAVLPTDLDSVAASRVAD
jgi:hypothetical protein